MNTNGLLHMIAGQRTRRLHQFTGNSGEGIVDEGEDASVTAGANVVSSERIDSDRHAVLLDLDLPAYLVPSSTPGHSHLYIDVDVPQDDYFDLLDVLARCGVVEPGYAASSKAKGGTYLRLPWVKRLNPVDPGFDDGEAVDFRLWPSLTAQQMQRLSPNS